MKAKSTIYGLLAQFAGPEDLVAAARKVSAEGYRKIDAYTPYPVEDLEDALRLGPSPVPLLVLLGGLAGAIGGFGLQYWVTVIQNPFISGGKPLNSWPAYIPVTFETTVLLAALGAVVGAFLFSRLPMPYHPVFNVPQFGRATQDGFFLSIEASDPRFDPDGTRRFLMRLNPQEVYDVPR